MVTAYNLQHLQVAAAGASPTYSDVNYATTFEPTITQDSETLNADGRKAIIVQGAPEGGGTIGFASAELDTIAIMTGGTVSTSGTAGTLIDRLEFKGSTVAPTVIYSAWLPNVDPNSDMAGLRVTLPAATTSVPSVQFGQETWSEFSADIGFVANDDDVMMIWESVATAPTFTNGVMPVNLTAPGG